MAAPSEVKEEDRQEEMQREEKVVEKEEEQEVEKEEEQEVDKQQEEDVGSKQGQHSRQSTEEFPNHDIFCGLGHSLMAALKAKLKTKPTKMEEKTTSEAGVRGAAGETSGTYNTNGSSGWMRRMLRAFDGDSYQKQLELKKENFGKIQQSFSEVHRVRKLLQLGKSVCKLIVEDVCQGTGFVLFDRFILTNAHLFNKCVEGNKLREGTDVYALFNYEEPEPHTDYHTFTAEKTLIDFDVELDYAILELNHKPMRDDQKKKAKSLKVPPGLLSKFGPPPDNGEACLIGHPAGEVKKIDPTCIIEMEKRKEAVDQVVRRFESMFIVQRINQELKDKGIKNIMMEGCKADKVVTYNTFMYHGSSGSPVFDAGCRVFGLHTAGYCYEISKKKQSVIEFAQPVLTIFESFVRNLHASGNKELLDRVEKAAEGNSDLQDAIQSVVGLR